jgi:hypothetical protein
MTKTKPIKRSSVNPKAGEIKGLWKKDPDWNKVGKRGSK